MVTIAVNPYLDHNFAPICKEITTDKLPVIGELPFDLSGMFVRNRQNRYGYTNKIALNADGCIGIAQGRIGIVEERIGIVEERIGIVEEHVGIAEGCIGIAKFNSLRINEMLY
ncbi:MAG: hypothetical protein V7L29_05975 [Nostoc sp.]